MKWLVNVGLMKDISEWWRRSRYRHLSNMAIYNQNQVSDNYMFMVDTIVINVLDIF